MSRPTHRRKKAVDPPAGMSPGAKGALRGLGFGWVFGMLLWTALAVVMTAPTFHPRYDYRVWDWSNFFHVARVAPIWGLLFTLPGAVVGFLAGKMRSRAPSYGGVVGAAIGAASVIATNPPNGWLALTVPLPALMCGAVGMVIGIGMKAAPQGTEPPPHEPG
jgi:hypothetical protein